MITLEHTVDELNAILMALGKRPFEEVAALIMKIKTAAEEQISAKAPVADPNPAPIEQTGG
jgi:hypothetical protein